MNNADDREVQDIVESDFPQRCIDRREMKIDRKNFLGEGGFGAVFLGKWNRVDVAVKVSKEVYDDGGWQRTKMLFMREICLCTHDDIRMNPHLMVTYGGYIHDRRVYTVMARYDGSVREFLDTVRGKGAALELEKKVSIARDAAVGLAHLHSKNILHRDLKADNLLVNHKAGGRMHVVIGDFGSSKKAATGSKMRTDSKVSNFATTVLWAAPEHHEEKRGYKYNKAYDVYSFACILYELLTLLVPWEKEGYSRKKVESEVCCWEGGREGGREGVWSWTETHSSSTR